MRCAHAARREALLQGAARRLGELLVGRELLADRGDEAAEVERGGARGVVDDRLLDARGDPGPDDEHGGEHDRGARDQELENERLGPEALEQGSHRGDLGRRTRHGHGLSAGVRGPAASRRREPRRIAHRRAPPPAPPGQAARSAGAKRP